MNDLYVNIDKCWSETKLVDYRRFVFITRTYSVEITFLILVLPAEMQDVRKNMEIMIKLTPQFAADSFCDSEIKKTTK